MIRLDLLLIRLDFLYLVDRYHSFKEALDNAREVLKINFFIEPEEVKSFSQVASERPSELIAAQAEVIKNFGKTG